MEPGKNKKENVINLEVYATLKVPVQVSNNIAILVFTSPSNVEAFFENNKVAPHQKVIAIGEATGKALEKAKVRNYILPKGFQDLDLVRAVMDAASQPAVRL